jgi:hypothetical protein
MKTKLIIAALAAAFFAPQGAQAFPGEVMITNDSATSIKPWFRSTCWEPGVFTQPPPVWIDFGNIGSGGRFSWDFRPITTTVCRGGWIDFTYTKPGEGPPLGSPRSARSERIYFDDSTEVYIQIGGKMDAIHMP